MANCKTCLGIARVMDEFMLPGKSKLTVASSRLPLSSHPCMCGSKCNWNGSHFLGVSFYSFSFFLFSFILLVFYLIVVEISVTDQNRNMVHGPAVFATLAKSSPILYLLFFIIFIIYLLII